MLLWDAIFIRTDFVLKINYTLDSGIVILPLGWFWKPNLKTAIMSKYNCSLSPNSEAKKSINEEKLCKI